MDKLVKTRADNNYSGNFVLENQTVASKQGFKNVSKAWYDKCVTYDEGLD